MLFQDLGLLVLLLGRVVAEVPDPEKDLVNIAAAQSVVVGNYFYTLGGYTVFKVPNGFPHGTKTGGVTGVVASNGHLRRIDLSRPFTVSKLDTVQEQSIPLSDEVPRMRLGTMWAHNTTIYLGPSELEPSPLLRNGIWINETRRVPTKGIWTYDTVNPDAGWARLTDLGYNDTFNPVTGASVAYLDGVAYITGGRYGLGTPSEKDNRTEFKFGWKFQLDSLFKLDMERKVATNETSSIGYVNSGRMVSIKGAGQKGILVHIGGMRPDGYNSMSTVRVYDIASSTWKTQRATSKEENSPRGRLGFCAVAISAQDYSSHQIYFYGGYYYEMGSPVTLDDVWVLTLPSFQLIKVGNSPEAAREFSTCCVISPQYLLAYGGLLSQRSNSLGNGSLGLLDLTDLKWKTEYAPSDTLTAYKVPRRVIEMIGGNEIGNATTTTPKGGFDDYSLADIFTLSDAKKPTSFSASTSSLKQGIVIGISIASAALALLSITGLSLIFQRRQRNRPHALENELRLEPLERQEADGNMVAPVKYELEGSRPVVHEIGSG